MTIFGALFEGLPIFGIGVKKHIAWSATTLYSDSSDTYFETIKDGKYLAG